MFLAFSLSDIIRIPFGFILEQLYRLTSDYGFSLILFAVFVKLILLPTTVKSKKGMMAMSRLTPLSQAIQKKYGDDQQKAQAAISQLYKDEGVSPFGGCLWSLLPMLLLLPLYQVIRQPMVYMLHMSAEQAAQVVSIVKTNLPDAFGANSYYDQVVAAPYIQQFANEIKNVLPELNVAAMPVLNFRFFGIDLGQIPQWQIWKWDAYTWNNIGLLLMALASAGVNLVSMVVSQKMSGSVATNELGEKDESAAKAAAGTNKTMMLIMPIMSLWIGFTIPSALSLYWTVQGIFALIADVILTKRYRKIYDAEDAQKRAKAALLAAEEAEKERIRAQRRAENPDGIVENTSKKKRAQQQRMASEAAAKEYAAKMAALRGEAPEEGKKNAPSGDPARPYAKGRNYKADCYVSFSSDVEDDEE